MDYNTPPPSHYEHVIDKNAIASIKQIALNMMDHLTGWCSKEKGGVLFDLVIKKRPDIIVEIGVFGGKSVVPMAVGLKANGKGMLYGIDPWEAEESVIGLQAETNKQWWGKLNHEEILNGLLQKIIQFKLEDQITLIRSTSENAPVIENIDILHIDGNHSEEASYFDVITWLPRVKQGGWIIFDDMTWNENGHYTTARAVQWLNTHCIKIAEFSEDCDWGIWVKS